MIVVAGALERAGNTAAEALPRIAAAVAVLIGGVILAALLGRLARRALRAVGIDDLGERFRIHDVLARVGLERSLSAVLGRVVRIALVVVAVVAAVSLLGLAALSATLNSVVLFVPKLFVALALLLIGVVAAEFVGERVDRVGTQMALGAPVGRLAQVGVFAIFLITAIAQLGISTEILMLLVAILLIAAASMLSLAFGLGSRELAREISAGRYVSGTFEIGQTITVGDLTGEIVALESAATVLRAADGRTLRVPNHMLVESVVTVDEAGG